MFPDLSILIVTYKRDDLLGACLASIRASCPTMPQTVVVDNADMPETQMLVQSFDNTVYIRSPGNPGFAGGNNIGLPACSGEYILLLNNDTVVHEEPFTYMIRYLKEHPLVGVVQGKVQIPQLNNLLDGCGSMITGMGVLNPYGFLVADAPDYCTAYPVFAANGACLMFRKSMLACAGGFLFHGHFKSYFEEIDFCHRIWMGGLEVHFIPSPVVDHYHSMTAKLFPRLDILRQYYANVWFSHLTCMDVYGLLRILPLFSLIYFGHSVLRLCTGQFSLFGIHYRAVWSVWKNRVAIRQMRRQLFTVRKRSSREIFKLVMHSPPSSYYLKLLRDIVVNKVM